MPANHDPEHTYGWSMKHESDLNCLHAIQHRKITFSPAEAEVCFTVAAQFVTPGTEVRGRLIGPRCLFASTIEVAYAFRPVPCDPQEVPPLTVRAVVPEPSFWDPQSPLLYRAVVELWQDGQRCDIAGFDLGFREFQLGESGLRCNGRLLSLRGTAQLPQPPDQATRWRHAGYNLVLIPTGNENWAWWVYANPLGFLMVKRLSLAALASHPIEIESDQPCFLGWLFGKELLDGQHLSATNLARLRSMKRAFIGIELDDDPHVTLPEGVSFLVCPESAVTALGGIKLPKIVLREGQASPGDPPAWATARGILGWVDR